MDHPDLVISIEDKNDEQEQPSSALFRRSVDGNTTFSYQNRTLETTIRCVGSAYNQTCLYQNLYYVDGQFIILTIKGRPLPFYTVSSNAFAPWPTTPSKRQFDSYADLEQFIASLVNRTVMPSVTLYFGQYWHFSIGHALFDGLYPAYLALIRFSPRHLHPFRILADIDNCTDCWVEDIYSRFAGLGLLKESTLQHMSHGRWFVFDELIMGSGTLCQRCTQPHLQLPGGVELNGSRLFRDRMYTQHDLPIPIRRRRRTLAAYIIDNKRFTFDDRREIDDAKVELNQYTYAMLRARNGPVARYRWPLILVHYLHYNRIRGRRTNAAMNSSRSGDNAWAESKFKGQLKVLRQMDIHVSGPGTGQMYQTFLSDGSVHVNLGGVRPIAEEHTEQAYASYLEQHMTSGTPYIKGLYYPINQRPEGIKKDQVIRLIRQAAQLIAQGFTIPVNPRDNLAADGRLFIEMCQRDRNFCSLVTKKSPERPIACGDLWVEDFVHEHGQWSPEGLDEDGQRVICPFNRTLLRQLRDKYGIDHYTDHWTTRLRRIFLSYWRGDEISRR